MKKKLNLNLLVVVVVIAGFSVFAAVRAYENYNANQPNTIIEQAGDITINQAQAIPQANEELGGTATFESPYQSWTVGGVRHEYRSANMTTATNTICALKAPENATSTLVFASAYFKYASSTAVTVTMAQAESAYATTTQIGFDYAIAANNSGIMLASSTDSRWKDMVFDGTVLSTTTAEYFVVSLRGGTDSAAMPTYSPSGRCQAEWIVNQY